MGSFIVMQGSTYQEEKQLGILWSPQIDKSGMVPHSWKRMQEFKTDDRIFHYVKGFIVAISVVIEGCREGRKPQTMQNHNRWNDDGYLVTTEYFGGAWHLYLNSLFNAHVATSPLTGLKCFIISAPDYYSKLKLFIRYTIKNDFNYYIYKRENLKMGQRILLVEDEEDISNLLELYLCNEGYMVDTFHDGQDALERIQKAEYDLAILDVMVPRVNGFELCKKIREKYLYPIIMLTAKIEDIDKITGLTIGADDYITKPFNPLEVMARVKTVLRRYTRYNEQTGKQVEEHDIRGLKINKTTHGCSLFGEPIDLTPIEFSILWYLVDNQGKVISSEELFENVWGDKFLNNNNTVMAHIARLREKLKEPVKKPKFIKTVWGVGYKVE